MHNLTEEAWGYFNDENDFCGAGRMCCFMTTRALVAQWIYADICINMGHHNSSCHRLGVDELATESLDILLPTKVPRYLPLSRWKSGAQLQSSQLVKNGRCFPSVSGEAAA